LRALTPQASASANSATRTSACATIAMPVKVSKNEVRGGEYTYDSDAIK